MHVVVEGESDKAAATSGKRLCMGKHTQARCSWST